MYNSQRITVFATPQSRSAQNTHRTSRREQVARMLINKFRQKFNVDFETDHRLDGKIVDAVNAAIKSDEPLGEKQLVMLSRKLTALVEDYRRKQR